MKKLIIITLALPLLNLMCQRPTGSFEVHFKCDFENNTLGVYQKDEWKRDWHNEYDWFDNRENITIESKGSTSVMKIPFPEGTSTSDENHGGKFYSFITSDESKFDEIYFSYDVMFKPEFDAVISGKIPSLRNGNSWPTTYPGYNDGSAAGIRWSGTGGNSTKWFLLFGYLYTHNLTRNNNTKQGTWGPVWMNPDKPDDYMWFRITEEKWYNITIRIVMNSVNEYGEMGDANGIYEGFINGKLACSVDTVIWRNVENIGTSIMRIYSAFGGSGDQFECKNNEWILVDNFYAWTYKDSVQGIPKGRQKSSWGRTLELPDSWSNTYKQFTESSKRKSNIIVAQFIDGF